MFVLPPTLTIYPGQKATYNITFYDTGTNFILTGKHIELTFDKCPAGAVCTFNKNNLTPADFSPGSTNLLNPVTLTINQATIGTYNITVTAKAVLNGTSFSNDKEEARTVELIVAPLSAAPTCASVSPAGGSIVNATSGFFNVYANGVSPDVTEVRFPTWGETNGQNDIVWYWGTNMGGGKWGAAINLANHAVGNTEYGNIVTHVYMTAPGYVNALCGSTYFIRPAPATCNPATVGTNQLSGCSYNGMNFNTLAGAAITGPVLSNPAPANGTPLPFKDWGLGGPNGLVDNYSVRFKGRFNFTPGSYTFSVGSDDGSRVYFDDNLDGVPDTGLLAAYWFDRGYSVTTGAPVNVSAGNHVIVYEMYENAGGSSYSLSWSLVSAFKPTITLTGPPFTFSGVSGGTAPASQNLVIGNSGNAALNWTWDRVNQAHNTSGVATWCKLQTAGGVDVPINSGGAIAASGSTTYKVVVSSPSTVGTFQDCNIRISDANATNNPQYADITYTVTPGNTCIGSGCGTCVGSICDGGSSNAVNASKLVCPAVGIHLSWVVGAGATSYNIYRAVHGSSPVFLVNTVGTSYDDNPAANIFYDYWIESKTGSLVSPNKVAANTNSTGGISPNTCGGGPGPTTVTIDNSICGKITVGWSTVAGATYNIYRNTSGNPPTVGDRIKQGATGNSYVDSSAPGVYYYWVTSVLSGIESAYTAPTVGSNPFSLNACIPNLSSSDKDIVAINGFGFTTGTCNGTDPLPSGTQLNLGDKVKFSLNFCNSGSAAATGLTITDKLTNLIMPTGGWNAKFNDGSGDVPIAASNISVTGTAPNQVITFKNVPDVPKPGAVPPAVRRITFEAVLSVPTNFSASSARFQNGYTAVYNEGTVNRFTPLIQFYTGKGIPTIIEIP
jgi:hypothetical protein